MSYRDRVVGAAAARADRWEADVAKSASLAARMSDPDHPDGPPTVDEYRDLLYPKRRTRDRRHPTSTHRPDRPR